MNVTAIYSRNWLGKAIDYIEELFIKIYSLRSKTRRRELQLIDQLELVICKYMHSKPEPPAEVQMYELTPILRPFPKADWYGWSRRYNVTDSSNIGVEISNRHHRFQFFNDYITIYDIRIDYGIEYDQRCFRQFMERDGRKTVDQLQSWILRLI